jgi:ABC-2 type transport system ATP-binding protein
MSARGYLMFVGEIRGIKNRRARADEALERVGLIDRAESHIRTLSKGMKQRVGLASALLHNPPVLILDEPTIGLDPLQVLELRALVAELGHDHTVLFSTHILSEAEQVCNKVIIINQGLIIAQGSPSELRSELERGGRVLVRVDAEPQEALTTIQSVPGVRYAEVGVDGIVATPTDASVDPRPQIARAVIEQGWSLMELRPLAVNLEEIFLEVTRHQAAEMIEEMPDTAEEEIAS